MMFIYSMGVDFIHCFIHLFHFILFHLITSYVFLGIDVIALIIELFRSTDVIVQIFLFIFLAQMLFCLFNTLEVTTSLHN